MSVLGGCIAIFQIDRIRLLDLIQQHVTLRGLPLSPPFQLNTPSGKGTILSPGYPTVNIVIDDVDLTLDVSTNTGHLLLRIDAGILRLPGSTTTLIHGGALDISIEFVNQTAVKVRLLSAVLKNLVADNAAAIPNFTALANAEANHLLDIDRGKDFDLLKDDPSDVNPLEVPAFIGGRNKNVDPNTFAILIGGPPDATVGRLIQGTSTIALAEAQDRVKSDLIEPNLRQQLLDPKDPNADLPPPWGNGKVPKDQDGVHVDITRLDLTFADGYIDVTGNFDAHDDCWDVSGGSFSQKMYLDFVPSPPKLVPRMDPVSPDLSYDVDVHFVCRLVEAVIGVLPGLFGAAIYGIGAVVAIEIVKASIKPSVTNQVNAIPLTSTIYTSTWRSVQIIPEGAIVQGEMFVPLLPKPVLPSVSISVSSEAELTGGTQGTVMAGAPCELKPFDYEEAGQRNSYICTPNPVLLIDPVSYQWGINGTTLALRSGTIRSTGYVVAALPPPSGTPVPNHSIEIGYQVGDGGFDLSSGSLALQTRDGDLNYAFRVEVRATDAIGRHFYAAKDIDVVGDLLIMGPEFDQYMRDCLGKIRHQMSKVGVLQAQPQPGDPVESLGSRILEILDFVRAGNLAARPLLEGAVLAYGADAVAAEMSLQTNALTAVKSTG